MTPARPVADSLQAAAASLHGLRSSPATDAAALEIADLLARLSAIEVRLDEEPFRPRPVT